MDLKILLTFPCNPSQGFGVNGEDLFRNFASMKILGWSFFIFFAVVIGLYPFTYLMFDMSQGLVASKSPELRASVFWQSSFYSHIILGGVALLVGWSQFSKRIRKRNVTIHRTLGKIYLISVIISGIGGLYIAFFATGGYIPVFGFSGLAISWLFTTVMAYQKVREKDYDQHEFWMIRSYALCFAAVTLRIWLPLFQFALGMEFIAAYRIIAWLCWVPNLLVAEWIVSRLRAKAARLKLY
jgi:uncharacterized membrane protein